jgi:SAM-dependent methyltransferase
VHRTGLIADAQVLKCEHGCRYPVVEGVPVMLLEGEAQTITLAQASIRLSREGMADQDLYLDTVGVTDEERRELADFASAPRPGTIDPVVSYLVGATNGNAYRHLMGTLREYPIPEIRLPEAHGQALLDVGCSWGRWSIAAHRKGYRTVGIDPSLGAVLAAKRACRTLGADALFVVGDARFLPFKAGTFDLVFSYSVLQHFSRPDASQAVEEIGRVLAAGGSSLIQMPSMFGLRCAYSQARRGFREGTGFEVRYWTIPALRRLFGTRIGRTTFTVDCFFGLGLQYGDRKWFKWPVRLLTMLSETLRRISERLTLLVYGADSLYLYSRKGSDR